LRILIFILTFFAGAGWAQQPHAAPVSKETVRVKLPKTVEVHVDNGLTILLVEEHRLPEIYMRFRFRGAGAFFDPSGMTGLAKATADTLLRGTATRTPMQIAREIDLLSTEIQSYAPDSATYTALSLHGLSENFERWFNLGIDELLHPAFSPDEFGRWRQQQLANTRNRRGDPSFLAAERFIPALFGPHPTITQRTPDNLETITTDSLRKWHDQRYAPQNAVLGIVGDVTPARILPQLKAAFSSWKRNDFMVPKASRVASSTESQLLLVDRPSAVQTVLLIGNIGPGRGDPDYEVFQVLNRVLLVNVRRNLASRSYAYISATTTNFTTEGLGGSWQLQTAFRTEVTDQALREVLSEVRQIRGEASRDERIAAERLESQKQYLVNAFALSLEHPDQVLQYSMDRKLYGLSDDYWDRYVSKISAVRSEDLQRVARKYVDQKTLQIIAVGDAAKIRAALEQHGKVIVYDPGGNVLP